MLSRKATKQKLESYETSIKSYEDIFHILRHGSAADSAAALQRIREGQEIGHLATDSAEPQPLLHRADASDIATPMEKLLPPDKLLTSPTEDVDYMFSNGYNYAHDQFVDKTVFVAMPALQSHLSRWTRVPLSNALMNHVLALFWTWDNCVERLMYRPMFEEDLDSLDPLLDDPCKRRFCSPFLVNALLALSCLYSVESETYLEITDPSTRGRQFAEEAEIALQQEINTPSIPLYQGLWAMFCYEGNLGSGQKAVDYLLMALDTYKAVNHASMLQPKGTSLDQARFQRERHAISWCMWGLYVTEWRASQPLGFRKMAAKPVFDKTWLEPDFPIAKSSCNSHWWFPYPMSLQTQLSMKIECREAELALAEIVESALDFITPSEYTAPAVENPQRALELYNAIVEWKYSLPDRLRFEDAVLPSTILLTVYAELMLTVVLRPFGQTSKQQFGKFDPRERCCSHANRMMTAIWTYRASAILRTEYWLVHAITTSALIVLQDLEIGSPEVDTLIRAARCLQEMMGTLPLAGDCLSTINAAFKHSGLQAPAYVHRYLNQARHRKDGLMHHAIAALLPTQNSDNPYSVMDSAWGPSFQELLGELEDTVVLD